MVEGGRWHPGENGTKPTQMNDMIQRFGRTILQHGGAGLTDEQLLGRFIEHRDEAAVAALVRRHGSMVWGVCRRVLGNHHDAEDAFQATFLVLLRKATSVRRREIVGNWLYGVAHQTALKARAMLAKRRAREGQMKDVPEKEAPREGAWRDLQAVLDQELSLLPEKYRVAIVLCDLEGRTRKQAAQLLGLPEGTMAGRLTRGRAILARRLARHGPGFSSGTVALALAESAATARVPLPVLTSTLKAVTCVAAGQTAAAGAISANVAALTEGVLKSMLLTKLKTAAALSLFVCILGTWLAASTVAGEDQSGGTQPTQRRAVDATAPPSADDAAPGEDKLNAFERRLRQLERANQLLTRELETLRKGSHAVVAPPIPKIEVKIIPLANHTPVDEIAKVLEKLFSLHGVRIVPFPSTHSIILQGTRADTDAVAAMIERLEHYVAQHGEQVRRAVLQQGVTAPDRGVPKQDVKLERKQ
jgi:RNA polymerase sigma factor (sigma-70 family)